MASEVLVTISKDWEERCYQESILKHELAYQSRMAYEKQQGRQEGRQEEKQEVIALLKSGKTLEQIINVYEN